ncbi:MAG TPA: hypothetical protein VFA45_11505 [Actinomycetes bacterium]|nr:hypothetical protein [Actinomycetes bacterium]
MARRLIIDEALTKRIAVTLRKRGRDASGIPELGYKGLEDPKLLRAIARDHPGAVLVTSDDHMPDEHGEILLELGITLATIDGRRPAEYEHRQEEWEWEIVHRWAHKMAEQEPGTWRRYGNRVTQWKARKRSQKFAATSEGDR